MSAAIVPPARASPAPVTSAISRAGGGAILSSFASYTLEKKLAKDPSMFGKVTP